LAGLSRDQAKTAIEKHLRAILQKPLISIEYVGDDPLLQKQAVLRAIGGTAAGALLSAR